MLPDRLCDRDADFRMLVLRLTHDRRNILIHVTAGIKKIKKQDYLFGAFGHTAVDPAGNIRMFQLEKSEFHKVSRASPAQTLNQISHFPLCFRRTAAMTDQKDR